MQAAEIYVQKETIHEEDENEVSGGAEEATSMNKKSKLKKSKKVPKPLEAPPSESAKSPDVSESPKTPKSSKLKKPNWFRKRSSSDSKALKPKSIGKFNDRIPFLCIIYCTLIFSLIENDSPPLELALTPVSPRVAEPSQDSSKPTSTTATKRSTGSVKRLSAFFEAKDKQQLGAEGR